VTGNQVAPLPLKFFALNEEDEAMVAHIEKLNAEEQEKCKAIYEAAKR